MNKQKQIIRRRKIFLLSILITSILFFIVFFCMGKILGHIEQQHGEVVSDVSKALENNLESGQQDLISNVKNYAEKSCNDVAEKIKSQVDIISEYFKESLDDLKENAQIRLYKCIDELEQHTKKHASQTFDQILGPQIEQNLMDLKSSILNILSNWLSNSFNFGSTWNFLKSLSPSFFTKSNTPANNNDLNNDNKPKNNNDLNNNNKFGSTWNFLKSLSPSFFTKSNTPANNNDLNNDNKPENNNNLNNLNDNNYQEIEMK
ncbi:hypothetical protein [Candidatus Phytoplasma bonamiae]|uniref:Uncharacterized protein n=1 Tax=Candidatus Phytoplasma bonamiae TaxID=2982626 RepID=A0ABT9D7N0_9MOLU|nr:hypothetical protein ['Bonamia sp.' little leaf phytoplasma]MDO8064096.1 hypothetical protein ['Bonamia sp.' little leaf phytoplasma]MDV3174459.1 hypothetical protein ['Bonamia sp.' little leaf phytoplasma]